MNLLNTGNLIQTKRKQINLTQLELAQKLNVSEKTISKWECGKGFPETSLILPESNSFAVIFNSLHRGKEARLPPIQTGWPGATVFRFEMHTPQERSRPPNQWPAKQAFSFMPSP